MPKVTIREAAELLGISENAAKKRFQRGTLRGAKGESGREELFFIFRRTDPAQCGVSPLPIGLNFYTLRSAMRAAGRQALNAISPPQNLAGKHSFGLRPPHSAKRICES